MVVGAFLAGGLSAQPVSPLGGLQCEDGLDVSRRLTEIVPLLQAFCLHCIDHIAYAAITSLGQYRATGLIVRGKSVTGLELPVPLAILADSRIKTISNRLLSSEKRFQEAQRED